MSNIKKDIEGVLNTLYEDILVSESELADGDRKTSLEIIEQALNEATTQIINLIESVIPEVKYHSCITHKHIQCAGCAVADIKSKLIGGE